MRSPAETVTELLEPRKVWLGKTTQVRRLLPHKERRMVGAWCFVDHYGPDDVREPPASTAAMRVPPHPHTSLQTVSWLFDGEVLHRDSVGSQALVRPGELNIMTAGPRDRALRGVTWRPRPRSCTGRSCGSRCRTVPATRSSRRSTSTPICRGSIWTACAAR